MAAIVRLRGGHDISTSRTLREALDSVPGSVRLDLTQCQFTVDIARAEDVLTVHRAMPPSG